MQPTEPQAILTPITEAAIFLTVTAEPGSEDEIRELLSSVSGLTAIRRLSDSGGRV